MVPAVSTALLANIPIEQALQAPGDTVVLASTCRAVLGA
jgi:hypothetical protein